MLPVRETQSNFRDAQLLPPDLHKLVQLNFDRLTAYEQVRDQFGSLRVRFEGAIALYPSNPAFAGEHRGLVIMPMADVAVITAYFDQPQQSVNAVVVGTRQVKVTAYGSDRQPLSRYFAGNRRQTHDLSASIQPLPEHTIELSADGVARIVFESVAPFVLKKFCFG
jgi:hypothetical protein